MSRGPRWPRRLARSFGRRRGRAVSGAVVLVASMMTVLGPSAPGAALSATPTLRPDCVNVAATHPPGHQYGVQFSGSLTASQASVITPGGLVLTIPGFSATVCGLISLPSQTANVKAEDIALTVNGSTATLGQAILPVKVSTDGPATGGVLPQPAAEGGLNLTIQAVVKNRTKQLGVSCDTDIHATLSTTPAGGVALSGPLSHATATLAVALAIPAGSTLVSPTCPGYLASQIDALIAMPLTPTTATATVLLDICVIPTATGVACPLPA